MGNHLILPRSGCLGLVFFNQYLLGLADHTELLLALLGLILLGLEVFAFPGFGVAGFAGIQELAVEHTTTPEEADSLTERLAGLFPKERIYRSTVSPVLGTHGGPGALAVTVLEAEKQ